jgi:uncharacterized protein (DUF1330 family)
VAFYALNLFDVKDPEGYREYISKARPINENLLGSEVLAFGKATDELPQKFPGSTGRVSQRWLLLVKFQEYTGPAQMFNNPDYAAVSHFRDDSTENYSWSYFQDANILEEV